MFKLVLRGLSTRKLRSVLSAVAILLGVAMISGTYVLTDQITQAFDDIFAKANEGTDVVVARLPAFDTSQQDAGPLPASVVTQVEGVPGVRRAQGQIVATGSLVVDGDKVDSQGGPGIVFSNVDEPFNTNELVDGELPADGGEIAVDKGLADREDLEVGQEVGLTTRTGVQQVRIVGVFRFAASSIGGASIVIVTLQDAQAWFDRAGQVSLIRVQAESGVAPEELVRRIQPVVGPGIEVQTGAQAGVEDAKEINDDIGTFLTPALLVFGIVGVLVGAFVIFNTLTITVAQRTRELGLLRSIGASRGQVLKNVMLEALAIGILASVLGLLVGLGFAKLLNVLFEAAGAGLPTASPELRPRTIVVALAIGIVVTLVAALIPSLRATRVPPIAALREGLMGQRAKRGIVAPIVAGVIGVVGVLLIVSGLFGGGGTNQVLFSMAGGALFIFIAMGVLARYLVKPLAGAIGAPLEALFGASGRLARENAARNPSRTASTSAALMIGVGLMVFVAIFAKGISDSFTGSIDKVVQGDLIIQGEGFQNIPVGSVETIRGAEGVESVLPVGFSEVRIDDGATNFMNGIDPALASRALDFDWQDGGSDALFDQLRGDGAVLEEGFAEDRGIDVGDTMKVTSIDNVSREFRVLGIYKDPILFTGFTVSDAAYDDLVTDADPGVIVVRFVPGADAAATQERVQTALAAAYPTAEVRSDEEYKENVAGGIDDFRNLLYALLALPVVISLFGIVNTLVLSVFERTREIGMMRAIGTSRRQVRSMIRQESIITAVIGGVLGLIIGLFFGWIITKALEDDGLTFVVPWLQLLIFLVMAVIAGIIAAALPARRAARLDVLKALQYE